jgi:vacuole morphology and inheritance protein 14
VRNGAELLDRLLKDTVTENSGNERFDIIVFMQLLRERIYVKNSYVRQFLVSWLKVLDSEPNIDIVTHISDLLDGLFQILDDPNPEIKKMCESLLSDLLKEITSPELEQVKHDAMINIILVHASNTIDDSIQHTAMVWLKELINIVGDHSLYFMPGILNVILPCLSYNEEGFKTKTREIAKSINAVLGGLVDVEAKTELENSVANNLAIDKVIESLSRFMKIPSDQHNVNTTIESLKWILHLVNKQPNAILERVDDFFLILISFLADSSKEVVDYDLQILSKLSTCQYFIDTNKQSDFLKTNFPKYNDYFTKFLTLLLDLFRSDVNLRYEKGANMIKKLCDLLNCEDIFRMLAEILSHESDPEFAISMVRWHLIK